MGILNCCRQRPRHILRGFRHYFLSITASNERTIETGLPGAMSLWAWLERGMFIPIGGSESRSFRAIRGGVLQALRVTAQGGLTVVLFINGPIFRRMALAGFIDGFEGAPLGQGGSNGN